MYNIPLFELNYDAREEAAALEVLRSGWISSGPKCEALEQKAAEMFSCKYALAVTNCTAALHLSLLSLGIGEGDEVIVPSITFVATANAIRYVGATPVFCDIESLDRPVADPEHMLRLITPKTRAIIVMHYGGFPCDMDRIMEIAKDHHLKVIEDACHGPLSEYQGKNWERLVMSGVLASSRIKTFRRGKAGLSFRTMCKFMNPQN